MFDARYNDKRFEFIHEELSKKVNYKGGSVIRKTASFYGDKLNVYIDTSDGVNIDVGIKEYCGRVLQIVNECKGKKFILFKTSYSHIESSEIQKVAQANNGIVLPFFIFSYYPEFYNTFLAKRNELLRMKVEKEYDIGFCCNLSSYYYPKANAGDPRAAWTDYKHFGVGYPTPTGDYVITTRANLYDKCLDSRFKFFHREKMDYMSFLTESLKWKVAINPPGHGEYTPRILESAALGIATVLRKSEYDNAISWRQYFPQVDFNKKDWQDDMQEIVDNYIYWGKKAKEYYDEVYQPKKIVEHFFNTIKLHE